MTSNSENSPKFNWFLKNWAWFALTPVALFIIAQRCTLPGYQQASPGQTAQIRAVQVRKKVHLSLTVTDKSGQTRSYVKTTTGFRASPPAIDIFDATTNSKIARVKMTSG